MLVFVVYRLKILEKCDTIKEFKEAITPIPKPLNEEKIAKHLARQVSGQDGTIEVPMY